MDSAAITQKSELAKDVILKVENLAVDFSTPEGVVHAVRDVSLQIRKGKTLGVVGESGCGKSVTAKSILQILPENGAIAKGNTFLRVDGFESTGSDVLELTELDAHGRTIREIRGKDIAMIFQEPMLSLSPVHTIGNQIVEAILLHQEVSKSEAREQTVEMLEYVGIPQPGQRIDSYPFELSGGMRQRAMIAMALVCRPRLLIADEPTTALDVTIQAQILKLIQRIQGEMEMSVMLITHDLGVIAAISHRIAVMYLGQIVESSTTRNILNNPKHPYTTALLDAVPEKGKRGSKLPAISGTVPGAYVKVAGCQFHPRCPDFIEGVCDKKEPSDVQIAEDHKVRCFLYTGDESA